MSCSSNDLHWPEPAQGPCSMVGHMGDGVVHAVPPDHRTPARDTWLYEQQETKRSDVLLLC